MLMNLVMKFETKKKTTHQKKKSIENPVESEHKEKGADAPQSKLTKEDFDGDFPLRSDRIREIRLSLRVRFPEKALF